ncbi:ATP-binding protein [Streptomyces sp. NPDC045470]|uniref:ATP-binding protein n=1 Tax=Streptomyces sp. NPDC045470 TaxID=3155469 RepID=UPI0033D2B05B
MKLTIQRAPGEEATDEHYQLVPGARQLGRDFVHERWPSEDLADTLGLVVTELLGNALRHGDGTVSAEFRYAASEHEIRLVVTDESCNEPRLALCTDLAAEAGRGLALVEFSVQEQRGRLTVEVASSGKAVICTFPAPEPGTNGERQSA